MRTYVANMLTPGDQGATMAERVKRCVPPGWCMFYHLRDSLSGPDAGEGSSRAVAPTPFPFNSRSGFCVNHLAAMCQDHGCAPLTLGPQVGCKQPPLCRAGTLHR